MNGRAAIREHYANEIATAWAKTSFVSDATGCRWRLGMALGNLECRIAPPVSGKYLEVWHRTAEGWRLHRDIWNLDAAEAHEPQ